MGILDKVLWWKKDSTSPIELNTTEVEVDKKLAALLEKRVNIIKQSAPQISTEHYVDTILADRAYRYKIHTDAMKLSPVAIQWAIAMSNKYGQYCMVHYFIADWITALLIIRYGEEPDKSRSTDPNFNGWPETFTTQDLLRAGELLQGKDWPSYLTPLSEES